MLNLQEIVENIKKINDIEVDELENEIICAFEDYEYEGESEIIVSSQNEMNCFIPREGTHSAYANAAHAPEVKFEVVENEDGTVSIADAWMA
jgi:hypothetical protein